MEKPKANVGEGGKSDGADCPSLEREEESIPTDLPPLQTRKTPFTNLSQVDADLALARTLQEQERAYMILRMGGEESDHGSWETVSYGREGDDDDDHASFQDPSHASEDGELNGSDGHDPMDEIDPSAFLSDEAYARALQHAEERENIIRLMGLAGINTPQDAPDDLAYEELVALGEVVGTESRGLSADEMARLPWMIYRDQRCLSGASGDKMCVICHADYEDGQKLTVLPCGHPYHHSCLSHWLSINKTCPVCTCDMSISADQ